MAQVFSRSANTVARASLVFGPLGLILLGTALWFLYYSPLVTMVGINRDQPIPFSHARHVGHNNIDCRYCHTSVEKSNFAGIPPTETCMTCHSQILSNAKMFEPLQESWKSGKSLEWNRIYDLPDFVYFDHSIHIAKGVGCTTCHGEIDKMPLTHKAVTLHMQWCLDCHKAPEKYLRPADQVFSVTWSAPANQLELGRELVKKNNIHTDQLTNCSICHR